MWKASNTKLRKKSESGWCALEQDLRGEKILTTMRLFREKKIRYHQEENNTKMITIIKEKDTVRIKIKILLQLRKVNK